MATYTPFAPNVNQNFTFSPLLDGTQYSVVMTWTLFGQRWVVNVFTLQGVRVLSKPLRTSPNNHDINLVEGYFTTSKMVYRAADDTFVVTP